MMRALGANAVLVDQVEGKPGNVSPHNLFVTIYFNLNMSSE